MRDRSTSDLPRLGESYRVIIYVGANQKSPDASRKKEAAHRFSRVDFQEIEGTGKNALDFHIAFQLGRTIETARDKFCIVLSKDKGLTLFLDDRRHAFALYRKIFSNC